MTQQAWPDSWGGLARLLPLISPPSRPQGLWAMVSGQLQVLFIHTSSLESNTRPTVRPKSDGSSDELWSPGSSHVKLVAVVSVSLLGADPDPNPG